MYDVVIIGGGPAGLTAGLYCARSGFNTLLLESAFAGGQIVNAPHVDNYPGFPNGISGFELGEKLRDQAVRQGMELVSAHVNKLSFDHNEKRVYADKEYTARAVILAMGARPRKLGIPGEDRLIGSGVSYCATCDGPFFKGKHVAVIGGGDTAAGDALYLASVASQVYLLHRRDTLRAAAAQANKTLSDNRIDKRFSTRPVSINGDMHVRSLSVEGTEGTYELPVDAVFVAVGTQPQTELLTGLIPLSDDGYILAGEDTKTPVEGVFAAGDIRKKPLRQVVTAASDGAVSAYMAENYLNLQ